VFRGHNIQFELSLATQISRYSEHPAEVDHAKQDVRSAALEIVRVIRIHTSRYGNKHMGVMHTQAVLVSLLAFLEESAQDDLDYSAEIIDLCIFFRAIARRFPLSMVAFRMFQRIVQQRHYHLPAATIKLFEDFEGEQWDLRQRQQVTSLYPAPQEDVGDLKPETMGDFVERLERLEVTDNAKHY
jgi:hypothetical protein